MFIAGFILEQEGSTIANVVSEILDDGKAFQASTTSGFEASNRRNYAVASS